MFTHGQFALSINHPDITYQLYYFFLPPLFLHLRCSKHHLTVLVLRDKLSAFSFFVITLFTAFLPACIHLSWTDAIRTIHRGGFTSTMTLRVFYLFWKKGFIGIALAFFTVRSHWVFIIILWVTDVPSYFSVYLQPACSGKKNLISNRNILQS